MTGRELWTAMGRVDVGFVEDAAAAPARPRRPVRRIAGIAACLCLLLAGTAWAAGQLWGVEITDIFRGREESGFRVALEGETVSMGDFSSPELTEALEAIRQQYRDYEAWDSQAPGFYQAELDTWAACESFLGVTLENPLEGLEGLEFFSNSGSEEAPHCGISLYADAKGVLEWVNVDAVYQTEACKVSLNIDFAPEEGGMEAETRYIYDGEADFTTGTVQLSDGREAVVLTTWAEDAKYSVQEAFFAESGGIYNLRVWRWAPAEEETERLAAVEALLEELLALF